MHSASEHGTNIRALRDHVKLAKHAKGQKNFETPRSVSSRLQICWLVQILSAEFGFNVMIGAQVSLRNGDS